MGKQEQTLTASHSDVGLWTNYRTLDLDRTLLLKKKFIKKIYYFIIRIKIIITWPGHYWAGQGFQNI